jgi:hypothetical protein
LVWKELFHFPPPCLVAAFYPKKRRDIFASLIARDANTLSSCAIFDLKYAMFVGEMTVAAQLLVRFLRSREWLLNL